MKTMITIISLLIGTSALFSQEFELSMEKGKEFLDQNNYVSALESFFQAYEIASSDSAEMLADSCKNICLEKISQDLSKYKNLKVNTESALRLSLNEPKTKANANKKLYELTKLKGVSHFNKKNYFEAYQLFKLAKLCPDYSIDAEIDDYIAKTSDSLNAIKKIALVVGNANYVEANLEKALVDAKAVGEALKSIHFDVIEGYNLKSPQFDEKIKELYEKAKGYDLVLFFYTGFGYQSDQLLPVDTKTDAEGNLKKWFSLNFIMSEFLKYNTTSKKIFILDMDRTANNAVLPMLMTYHNCMVFYSAAPANKAFNGVGKNSLFTEQLLKFLTMPNTPFQEIFRLTREATMRVSKNRQVPTLYDNIQNNIYLNLKLD